jgi:aspartate/methionine/tyrosine aminotransferase
MVLKSAGRGMVPPFMAMEVMREAAELEAAGQKIIHLEVGQPSTGMPQQAIARVKSSLEEGPLGYTLGRGLPDLCKRIAHHYQDFYGVTIPTSRIIATTGSSAGFILSFLSAFDAGDRVALAAPGYPAYRHILKSLAIVPKLISVDESTRFQPTVDHLKSLPSLPDGLIVGSPANPTGSILPAEEFRELAEFCERHGIRLISDEIYHGITYGMASSTAAEISETAIVINSFSKYFCMTGWRLGWLVVPPDLNRSIECLAQNLFIAPPTISQYGGIEVFDCQEELNANVQRYSNNRDILLSKLPELGFDKLAPADGAFYVYADISAFSDNSETFCKRMLHEAGVATTPGIDFDPLQGHQFIRISFAGTSSDMQEACVRLKAWRDHPKTK